MKTNIILFIVLILGIVLPLNPLFASAEKEIEVEGAIPIAADNGTILAEVSPYMVNGFNFNNAMQVFTIKELVAKLNIVTITYPAGNIGDDQDLSEYELKFFKNQQEYVGKPFTFVQARLFGGTPEDAVEAIRLTRELGIRVDIWTIGNEPDLYPMKRNDYSWTPEKYNTVFREYADAMRSAYPDIKLAGPAVSQPKNDWVKSFIAECGDLVDVLVWHWYPTDGKQENSVALQTAAFAAPMIAAYKEWLKDPAVNPKGYTRDIKTGITEWAIHWDTDRMKHLTDMTGVLWSAEVLGVFAELGIDYSHYFCLNQYGGHAIFTKLNKPRYMYYLFVMFAEHFGKQIIKADTEDSDLRVRATRINDKEVSLFLINQNPDTVKTVEINVESFGAIKKARAFHLNENEKNTPVKDVKIQKKKNSVVVTLSPYSVTVVRIGM